MSDDEQQSDGDDSQQANMDYIEQRDISDAQQSPSTICLLLDLIKSLAEGMRYMQ